MTNFLESLKQEERRLTRQLNALREYISLTDGYSRDSPTQTTELPPTLAKIATNLKKIVKDKALSKESEGPSFAKLIMEYAERQNGQSFTLQQVTSHVIKHRPDVKKQSVGSIAGQLVKRGKLKKFGKAIYALPTPKEVAHPEEIKRTDEAL